MKPAILDGPVLVAVTAVVLTGCSLVKQKLCSRAPNGEYWWAECLVCILFVVFLVGMIFFPHFIMEIRDALR